MWQAFTQKKRLLLFICGTNPLIFLPFLPLPQRHKCSQMYCRSSHYAIEIDPFKRSCKRPPGVLPAILLIISTFPSTGMCLLPPTQYSCCTYHSVVPDTELWYWSHPINKDESAQLQSDSSQITVQPSLSGPPTLTTEINIPPQVAFQSATFYKTIPPSPPHKRPEELKCVCGYTQFIRVKRQQWEMLSPQNYLIHSLHLIVLAECLQNRYQCETGLATLSSLQTINGQKLAKWSIYHESVRITS